MALLVPFSEGRKIEVLGEYSFAELNLFDLRKAAYLIGDAGPLLGGEGSQRIGQVAPNLGEKEGLCGSLSDQGGLKRLAGGTRNQEYRVAG